MNNRIIKLVILSTAFFLLTGCGLADLISPPTPTPVPPTETPLPTPTPEPEGPTGFEKFEAGGIELWLPESFEGGDLSENLDVVLAGLEELGPAFEQQAQLISQNPDMFVFFGMDTEIGPSGFGTNVNIGTAEGDASVSIQMFIDATIAQLPPVMSVVGSEVLTINEYPSGKIELAYDLEGTSIHQLIYIIQPDSTVWIVTYTTSEAEFEQRAPDFELSINSFKVNE
jgi:hypothetical protein